MPVAIRAALLLAFCACAACGSRSSDQPNAEVAANAPADIVTLPPDESDATPTNELENGVDEPTANTVDLNSD